MSGVSDNSPFDLPDFARRVVAGTRRVLARPATGAWAVVLGRADQYPDPVQIKYGQLVWFIEQTVNPPGLSAPVGAGDLMGDLAPPPNPLVAQALVSSGVGPVVAGDLVRVDQDLGGGLYLAQAAVRPSFLVRITGLPASGTADYPWVRLDESSPLLPDSKLTGYPYVGTTSQHPAREVNSNRWIGPWTKARVFPTADGAALLFEGGQWNLTGTVVSAVNPGATGFVDVTGAFGTVRVETDNRWHQTMPAGTYCAIGWMANRSRYEFVALDCPLT